MCGLKGRKGREEKRKKLGKRETGGINGSVKLRYPAERGPGVALTPVPVGNCIFLG